MKIVLQKNSKGTRPLKRPHLSVGNCIKRNATDIHPNTDWRKIVTDGDESMWMFGLKGRNKKKKYI